MSHHIARIRDLQSSNELSVMTQSQANFVSQCYLITEQNDEHTSIIYESDFTDENSDEEVDLLNQGFFYDSEDDSEDDDVLNQGFFYDPENSDDEDMLNFLDNCFKKRRKLNDINNKNGRHFQIIYIKDVLKKVEKQMIDLN